jgi:hypothetical protein
MNNLQLRGVAAIAALACGTASAADIRKMAEKAPSPPPTTSPAPPPPAPMGVFGADMPAEGKLVLSITPNFAHLAGHRIGDRGVSSEQIVATTPWFNSPTAKLRLVPQHVRVATQTVGLAYGVTKNFALVLTAGMVERNLDMLTFRGPAGVQRLGMSYTGTAGLQDFTLSGVYRIYQDPIHRIQLNLGMSFPTGSTGNTFTLLSPAGQYVTSRAFYALQPGTGTFDVMPGIVYAGYIDQWSWGVSYRGRFPLAENGRDSLEGGEIVQGVADSIAMWRPWTSGGYRWGDLHEFNGWVGYTWIPGLTTTARVNATLQGPIRGFDPMIRGRAQAANPNFYGGERVEIFGGANISGKFIGYENVSVAIEAGVPVYQYLNGPQIRKNWQAGMSLRFKI